MQQRAHRRSRLASAVYGRGVRLTVALAVVVVALPLLTAASPGVGDVSPVDATSDHEIDNRFAAFYAEFVGISVDDASDHVGEMLDFYESEFDVGRVEAEVQARLDLLAGELRELAHERYSTVWAGSWIEREPTHRIVFSFTERGDEVLAELVKATGFPIPERLATVSARWTMEELLAEQRLVSEVRDELYPWTGDAATYEGFESHIDEVTNTVVVSGPDPERYQHDMAGRHNDAMVRFEKRPLSRPASPQDNSDPKMYGGLALTPEPGCTSGYVVVKNNSQETAVTTAAHCHGFPATGDVIQHGGQTIDDRVYHQMQGQIDTEMWSLLDAFWEPDDNIWETPWVTRDIGSVHSYWSLQLGEPVWKVGRMTQKTTGVITEFGVALAGVPGSSTAVRTSATYEPGDSGGPVYYGAQAFGTVWGGGGVPGDWHDMIFLAADWWDGESGWRIATSPPAVPGHDWYLKNSHSGGNADLHWEFGSSPRVPVSGDWNGDGDDQPGVFYPATRQWDLQGEAVFTYGYDSADLPIVGDWDGDGDDEVGVYRPAYQRFYRRGTSSIPYGDPGDVPIVGDWDNDSVDEIGVYRPSQARFYLRGEPTTPPLYFGAYGDQPITGDWDGGDDDIGVYRPSNQTFYLRKYNGAVLTIPYGDSGDTPITGDWDGNGIDTIGVVR